MGKEKGREKGRKGKRNKGGKLQKIGGRLDFLPHRPIGK